MQVKQVLESRVQNIRVEGEHYEVTGAPAHIAALIGHLRLVCFAFLFAGDMIFNAIGGLNTMPGPVKDGYTWIANNKFQFGMVVFLMSSVIQANLLQSGAFEIYINGNLEYSKLERGAMPDWPVIQEILRKYGKDLQM